MNYVQTFENFLNEGTEYAVVLVGGSIGDKPRPRDAKGYAGMDAKGKELFSLDKAKEKATRMNKTVLSPGEKSHYGLKYIVVPVENGKFIKESVDVNEAAYVPSNILDFAKREGSFATSLVKKAAGWAEKCGKKIVGGTAIGKNYSTLVLDMKYQGGEIRINLDNETIKLFDEEVTDAKSFKKVLDANAINEGKMEGSGRTANYQMENSNNGLRNDSIFINAYGYGSKKNTMNIKISMYSGGSDGIDFDLPKKLAELNDAAKAADSTKDEEIVKAGATADMEKSKMLQDLQAEIFDAVAKEMDAFDKKLGAIVTGIVKKY